ncbi:MAG: hypothetical protein QOF07_2821 [Bradyrhizobium sp.]|nr:hypothetical protein [Bradyrhizobium sp.]
MRLLARSKQDDGAALIIVLILITAVALVMGAILSLADTNVRSTVALRNQAGDTYNADSAAQVAVDQLRRNKFNNTTDACTRTSSSQLLSNFYPGTNGGASSSAYVQCTPDGTNGTAGHDHAPNTSPGSAILTLATVASGEDGIYVNSTTPGVNSVKVRGGIFSNSTINVAAGQLENTWTASASNPTGKTYTIVRGACTGTIIVNSTYGTKTCNIGNATDSRGADPGTLASHGGSYDPPTTASTANSVISTCSPSDKSQTVSPGRLTSAAALNALTGCSRGIVYFSPGVYFFDFQDVGEANRLWNIQNVFVVAGTPSSPSVLTANPSASTWPNACVPPTPTGTALNTGAEFVFGGNSRLQVTHQGSPGGQLTICGSNTSAAANGGPPIAVYGLKTAVGPVAAQSGCVTDVVNRCPLIYTDQSPNTSLTIQGTTYTPKSWLNISLNNSTNQVFRWGLITRSLSIGTTGSPDVSAALIDVPDEALIPVPTPNIMYLDVYVCPASSACSTSGRLQLRVKALVDPSGAVSVLSWGNQR